MWSVLLPSVYSDVEQILATPFAFFTFVAQRSNFGNALKAQGLIFLQAEISQNLEEHFAEDEEMFCKILHL